MSADFCARRGRPTSAARRGTPRRLPREDPRAEVGEEVRIGVDVGVRVAPVEFKLNPGDYEVTIFFIFLDDMHGPRENWHIPQKFSECTGLIFTEFSEFVDPGALLL